MLMKFFFYLIKLLNYKGYVFILCNVPVITLFIIDVVKQHFFPWSDLVGDLYISSTTASSC